MRDSLYNSLEDESFHWYWMVRTLREMGWSLSADNPCGRCRSDEGHLTVRDRKGRVMVEGCGPEDVLRRLAIGTAMLTAANAVVVAHD
jgi:hypothetical protein